MPQQPEKKHVLLVHGETVDQLIDKVVEIVARLRAENPAIKTADIQNLVLLSMHVWTSIEEEVSNDMLAANKLLDLLTRIGGAT